MRRLPAARCSIDLTSELSISSPVSSHVPEPNMKPVSSAAKSQVIRQTGLFDLDDEPSESRQKSLQVLAELRHHDRRALEVELDGEAHGRQAWQHCSWRQNPQIARHGGLG